MILVEFALLYNNGQDLDKDNITSVTTLSFNKHNAIVTKCVDVLRYYRDSSPERKHG